MHILRRVRVVGARIVPRVLCCESHELRNYVVNPATLRTLLRFCNSGHGVEGGADQFGSLSRSMACGECGDFEDPSVG